MDRTRERSLRTYTTLRLLVSTTMITERTVDALVHNLEVLVQTIQDCVDNGRLLPCLSLLYTGIDVVASLERQPNEGTRASFTRWAERYMVNPRALPVTSLELYGARCGVVHTFTSDSDLHKQGQVRQVLYAWGTASPEPLQRTVDALGKPAVAVHINDLVHAFRQGVADYLDGLASDEDRLARIGSRAGLWFDSIHPGLIEAFNTAHDLKDAT